MPFLDNCNYNRNLSKVQQKYINLQPFFSKNFNTTDIIKDYSLYVKESNLYVYKKLQTTPNLLYDTNMPLPLYHFKVN